MPPCLIKHECNYSSMPLEHRVVHGLKNLEANSSYSGRSGKAEGCWASTIIVNGPSANFSPPTGYQALTPVGCLVFIGKNYAQ